MTDTEFTSTGTIRKAAERAERKEPVQGTHYSRREAQSVETSITDYFNLEVYIKHCINCQKKETTESNTVCDLGITIQMQDSQNPANSDHFII